MLNLLRDPVWQFVGVAIAVVAAAVPIVLAITRRRRSMTPGEEQAALRERYAPSHGPGGGTHSRHKGRRRDGILFANISSDFLNRFPLPVGILVAHLDRLYTPENFGSSDWQSVFRRVAAEGYFVTADGTRSSRITLETPVGPGPKMSHWLSLAASIKREVLGLDGD
jgi:hypothetical protein